MSFPRDRQYFKFCAYGFLKNLKFFDPFLILFLRDKGLDFTQIGLLYALRETGTALLEIPTGLIADALGRRRTMVSSFFAYIVSFLLFSFASQFPALAGAMLLFSFGEAFRTGTHKAMIYEYLRLKGLQDQRVHYYGHTRAWSQIGSALSALLAAFVVIASVSYRNVFLASILPYLLDLLLLLSYPAQLDGERTDRVRGKILQRFRQTGAEFFATFRDRHRLRAVSAAALYSGYYKALKDYLQPLLKALALTLPWLMDLAAPARTALLIGAVYSLLYLLTAAVSRHSGRFAERQPDLGVALNRAMILGLLAGLGSGLLLALDWKTAAVIAFLLVYLLENLRKPVSVAYVGSAVDPSILATALSVQSQFESLCAAVLALLLGFLADAFGLAPALVILSGFVLLFFPLLAAPPPRA